MNAVQFRLVEPDSAELLQATREIFREYADSLNIDLCFQNFDAELAGLPGEYTPPRVRCCWPMPTRNWPAAWRCAACSDVDHANACEMKRLFVRRAFRRFGLGRVLAQALMERAASAGYSAMLLDTLDEMESARELYASLGFEEVAPYYFNPIPGAHYLKAPLA